MCAIVDQYACANTLTAARSTGAAGLSRFSLLD
jgi:hypothetical protein